MKGSKYNENQILAILKEVRAGAGEQDVCRKYRIGQATYNKWVHRYGGMAVYEMERIQQLEAELSELKIKYAELTIENEALKSVIGKNISK